MTSLDKMNANRLKEFLLRIVDLTSCEDCRCIALKYHKDKEFVNKFFNLLGIGLESEGIAFQLNEKNKFIVYDDSLPIAKELEVFAHEAGHCILGHVSPPVAPENLEKTSQTENAQQEWEADFFSAMFMFVADGALFILKSWDREHVYSKLKGGAYNG